MCSISFLFFGFEFGYWKWCSLYPTIFIYLFSYFSAVHTNLTNLFSVLDVTSQSSNPIAPTVAAAAVATRKSPSKQSTRSSNQGNSRDSNQSMVVVVDVPSAPVDPESEGEGEGRDLNLPLPVSSPEEMLMDDDQKQRTPHGPKKKSGNSSHQRIPVEPTIDPDDALWPAVDESVTEEGGKMPPTTCARSKTVYPSTNTHTVQVCCCCF